MTNAVDIPISLFRNSRKVFYGSLLEFQPDLRIFSLIYSLEAKDPPNPFEIKPPSNNETAYHSASTLH